MPRCGGWAPGPRRPARGALSVVTVAAGAANRDRWRSAPRRAAGGPGGTASGNQVPTGNFKFRRRDSDSELESEVANLSVTAAGPPEQGADAPVTVPVPVPDLSGDGSIKRPFEGEGQVVPTVTSGLGRYLQVACLLEPHCGALDFLAPQRPTP